jgi:chromosomal replication initiator protein
MWLWEQVLSKVAEKVPAQHFEIWFRPTALQSVDDQAKEFRVLVPNRHFRYWLTEKYQSVLDEVLHESGLDNWRIRFAAEDETDPAQDDKAGGGASNGQGLDESASSQLLTPRYSFETFVVGFSNQFAHAAAMAVAVQPACAYNPLFLYGGVGLGKTHLMHAIGHRIRSEWPHLRLAYISSEAFVNELIHAIRFDYDQDGPVSREVSQYRCPAHGRHPVPGRQGADPGGVLSHVQRPV